MAHGLTRPRRGYGRRIVEIDFRFFPNGTSNDALTVHGEGVASVVRNGSAGEYLVTLSHAYYQCHSAKAQVQLASAADLNAQVATISNLGTSTRTTLLVRALAGATPTDISANANNAVSVSLKMSDAVGE